MCQEDSSLAFKYITRANILPLKSPHSHSFSQHFVGMCKLCAEAFWILWSVWPRKPGLSFLPQHFLLNIDMINTIFKKEIILDLQGGTLAENIFKGTTGGCHMFFPYSFCFDLPLSPEKTTEVLQPRQSVFLPLSCLALSLLPLSGSPSSHWSFQCWLKKP